MSVDLTFNCVWSIYDDIEGKVVNQMINDGAVFVNNDGDYLWLASTQLENEIRHLCDVNLVKGPESVRSSFRKTAKQCKSLIEMDVIAACLMPVERDFAITKLPEGRGWEIRIPIDMIASQRSKSNCDMIEEEVLALRNGTIITRFSHDMVLMIYSFLDKLKEAVPGSKKLLEGLGYFIKSAVTAREMLLNNGQIRIAARTYSSVYMSMVSVGDVDC